jgi:hypothetical protein
VGVKRNVTVQLDEEVIAKVKLLAAKRGTSISGLVAEEINKLTAQHERYERARQAALARLTAPAEYSSEDDGSGPADRRWSRDEIYAQRSDRWLKP